MFPSTNAETMSEPGYTCRSLQAASNNKKCCIFEGVAAFPCWPDTTEARFRQTCEDDCDTHAVSEFWVCHGPFAVRVVVSRLDGTTSRVTNGLGEHMQLEQNGRWQRQISTGRIPPPHQHASTSFAAGEPEVKLPRYGPFPVTRLGMRQRNIEACDHSCHRRTLPSSRSATTVSHAGTCNLRLALSLAGKHPYPLPLCLVRTKEEGSGSIAEYAIRVAASVNVIATAARVSCSSSALFIS